MVETPLSVKSSSPPFSCLRPLIGKGKKMQHMFIPIKPGKEKTYATHIYNFKLLSIYLIITRDWIKWLNSKQKQIKK